MSFTAKFILEVEFDDSCDSGSPQEFFDMLRAISRVGSFFVIDGRYRLPYFERWSSLPHGFEDTDSGLTEEEKK